MSSLCHLTVMKQIHTIAALAAFLAIASPAFADEPAKVAVKTDLNLTSQPEPGYPYLAQRASLSGSCRLAADIDQGKVNAVRVVSCSSGLFRNEAVRTARALTFAPNTTMANAGVEIRWDAPKPQPRKMLTASRD